MSRNTDLRRRQHSRRYTRGASENLRGPLRALTLDEQLEIQRLMREATANRARGMTVAALAVRYGVSSRTIWRYVKRVPVPVGLEFLRMRVEAWARERDIDLTHDDVATLMFTIARHREMKPELAATA